MSESNDAGPDVEGAMMEFSTMFWAAQDEWNERFMDRMQQLEGQVEALNQSAQLNSASGKPQHGNVASSTSSDTTLGKRTLSRRGDRDEATVAVPTDTLRH